MAGAKITRMWDVLDPLGPPTIAWLREPEGDECVLLLGAFDPPTNAHVSLVRAAARLEDAPAAFCMTKVLLARPDDELLPAIERIGLLDRLAGVHGTGLVLANRGTYIGVARALRSTGVEPSFVIGSDKLTQLGDPAFYPDGERGVAATFEELRFLVVPRLGADVERDDVVLLDPSDVFTDASESAISATLVRRRLRDGASVADLVPPEVASALGGYTATR